jgi:hypothetical protein
VIRPSHVRLGLLVLAATVVIALSSAPSAAAGILEKPIDPRQQTALRFGDRSHWLQPWRAYLDTPPATRLRNAIGINFNHVNVEEAGPTARLLGRSGFRRARVELGWSMMSYGEPGRLSNPTEAQIPLRALRANGIRPLILLNSFHGLPAPARYFDAVLLAPARQGDRRVLLARDTARQVVPHKTGLNSTDPWRAADVIFTSVSAHGWATLSRPLPRSLAPGRHSATTLRFAPFGPPRLAGGRPNPLFEETMQGWLIYVGAVTREARRALGSDAFDVEVWNELSFGSDFLYQERYYDPPRERGRGDVTAEILKRTVGYLREPRNGVSKVRIANGFASQAPWASGATSPRGLSAISKHPYEQKKRFPRDQTINDASARDALGRTSFRESVASSGTLRRRDRFIPTYSSFFPEFPLTAVQTEHLIRDISPLTTDLYGVPHGRRTHPRGGGAPAVWVTEANLDPEGTGLSSASVRHMHAKAALRYYTSFANKGVSAVHLFGVRGAELGLVDDGFFASLSRSRGAYPGDSAGGEAPTAIRRLVQSLAGATAMRKTRRLSLHRVSDRHNHRQFAGGGSAAHPPLYNRDVLAFLPFQLRPGAYVAAVYVMTRDLSKVYRPSARQSDPTRYDLPPERFRLTIGGLRTSRVSARASDPLTGATVPVKVRRKGRTRVAVELPVTDSPRMLRLVERRSGQ